MPKPHRHIRGPLAAAALLVLAGCVDPASVTFTGASAVTAANTGKTLSDHAMTYLTSQNCTYRNVLKGTAWCQPLPSDPPEPNGQVCYQSLANITCYTAENPFETPSRRTP